MRASQRLQQWIADLRRMAGMPNYAEYRRHLQRCHPDQPVPSEREFFDLYLQSRYGDGPTRCC